MCGRYTLAVPSSKIALEFKVPIPPEFSLRLRYNIAPTQEVPVITSREGRRLELFRWGFIPSWAKDPEIGNRIINARRETLLEKPSFRTPFKFQRCLILADGFYEWKKLGNRKRPYYICLKSKNPFAFAGLWSRWKSPEGKEVYSCAIITGEPNEIVRPIHERMPVILPKRSRDEWLDPSSDAPGDLLRLLSPYPAEEMEGYPVSTRVNSPSNDTADCIERVL